MRLLIVRHGQTIENIGDICQGQTPGTLSATGIMQAKTLAEELSDYPIDKCYSSDLRRAEHTAGILYRGEIILDQRLRERYFGSLQGTNLTRALNLEEYSQEVETPEQMWERIDSFMQELKRTERPESTLLIVSHGFTIKIITAYLTGAGIAALPEIKVINNCSLNEFNF